MTAITARFVGGPRDGEIIRVQDGLLTVSVAADHGCGDYVATDASCTEFKWAGYWYFWGDQQAGMRG